MGKAIRPVLSTLAALMIVGLFVTAFIAYFVTSIDPVTKQIADGFGRPLTPTPLLFRMAFNAERLWPGFFWFVADLVWFFGGLALAVGLFSIGEGTDTNQSGKVSLTKKKTS